MVKFLRPKGLLRVGLYSSLARQHIESIRRDIASTSTCIDEVYIRSYRKDIIDSPRWDHKLLTTANDFYSLSALRDLIFHVQEQNFTIPKIQNALNSLGLTFCGFDNEGLNETFSMTYPRIDDRYDLEKWNEFEKRYPRSFSGMYQFWCQN